MRSRESSRRRLLLRARLLALAALLVSAAWAGWAQGEDHAAAERRLADTARYLASDELEGRGIGTEGLDRAAEHIATRLAELGLKTDLVGGTPYQTFRIPTRSKLGDENVLALVGPPTEEGGEPVRIDLHLGEDFTPMAMSGSGRLDLPLVFAGYGITAREEGYDDYAEIEAEGDAVVVLRHEPQQDDPESLFAGTENSEHAPFRRKVSNAYEHEAEAVLFCTDGFTIHRNLTQAHQKWQAALDRLAEQHAAYKKNASPTSEKIETQRERIVELLETVRARGDEIEAAVDPLLPFGAAGRDGAARDFPVVFCRREPLGRVCEAALDTDLATLERRIDERFEPQSAPLAGWRVVGHVEVEREVAEVKNVLAVLEGEGPLADETLVIGAHYDHLGRKASKSGDSAAGAVYNGADDNASGVAVMLEIARSLARRDEPLRRRVLFIGFTAEERGLIGSQYYVDHPLFPIEKTIAVLNLDMVGRLRDDKLIVGGAGTALQFDALLDRLGSSHGLQLTKQPSGHGPSDHASFYAAKVPAMHFFTGLHGDVHRPSDQFEKLKVAGMRRIGAMVSELAVALANADQPPEYAATGPRRVPPSGGKRPYFGTVPDFSHTGPGYGIRGVVDGSPAQKAGLQGGDVIARLGESRIGSLEDFDSALRKHKAGERVEVVVERSGKEHVFQATLEAPR